MPAWQWRTQTARRQAVLSYHSLCSLCVQEAWALLLASEQAIILWAEVWGLQVWSKGSTVRLFPDTRTVCRSTRPESSAGMVPWKLL